VCWSVWAFVLYGIVRYTQADIEYLARQELIRVLVYGALFFIVLNHLYRQETSQMVVFTLLALRTLISLYAMYQFLSHSEYVWHLLKPKDYMHRGSGTYICPNHLAGFLEMLLPLGLAFIFLARLNAVTKVVLGYATLMILAAIGFTISRGGWIASI